MAITNDQPANIAVQCLYSLQNKIYCNKWIVISFSVKYLLHVLPSVLSTRVRLIPNERLK